MGNELSRLGFERGYAGVAFTGHASAHLRPVNQFRAKLSMVLMDVFSPTVGNILLIVDFEVSLQFSNLLPVIFS